jgi:hypothetical protein
VVECPPRKCEVPSSNTSTTTMYISIYTYTLINMYVCICVHIYVCMYLETTVVPLIPFLVIVPKNTLCPDFCHPKSVLLVCQFILMKSHYILTLASDLLCSISLSIADHGHLFSLSQSILSCNSFTFIYPYCY